MNESSRTRTESNNGQSNRRRIKNNNSEVRGKIREQTIYISKVFQLTVAGVRVIVNAQNAGGG